MIIRYDQIRRNVFLLLDPSQDSTKISYIVNMSIFGLIILNVVAVVVESVKSIQAEYYDYFFYFEINCIRVRQQNLLKCLPLDISCYYRLL